MEVWAERASLTCTPPLGCMELAWQTFGVPGPLLHLEWGRGQHSCLQNLGSAGTRPGEGVLGLPASAAAARSKAERAVAEAASKRLPLLSVTFQVVFISPWNFPNPCGQEGI